MAKKKTPSVGIDDLALYIPKLHLPIATLAEARGIEYAKLNKGLGLIHMTLPDFHEDTATMAANAIATLIDKNKINPHHIGRIYLGTESALDGSKPTATYAVEMLAQKYSTTYGANCFSHCDATDIIFACAGGVDALHNTLDWVRNDAARIGIVVCSDFAKYELDSSGEYTQGAGAVAVLIKHNPRILAIEDVWGVAMMSVHDFFKPKRNFSKAAVIEEVLELMENVTHTSKKILSQIPETLAVRGVLDINEITLTLHKDTPIFDGQYSNQCYQDRIREAYQQFRAIQEKKGGFRTESSLLERWHRIVFHLPYSAHGRRIFSEIFMLEKNRTGELTALLAEHKLVAPKLADFPNTDQYNVVYGKFLTALTKTTAYNQYVSEAIARGQWASSYVGNMYTGSILLSLMSSLALDFQEGNELTGKHIGFIAYGSGSKAKIFDGVVQKGWRNAVKNFKIEEKIKRQKPLSYDVYESLHRGKLKKSITSPKSEFTLHYISTESTHVGARHYKWVGK
jgi:hydroxymethylglutaryl-CoA synthase